MTTFYRHDGRRERHRVAADKHVEANSAAIEAEARQYAKTYNVSLDVALRDVADEYRQGYFEGEEAARTTDWDYGCE